MTDRAATDRDFAILVATFPIWATAFVSLFAVGLVADWWRARQ